ncbi:hypothetical protein [Xiamenia xianingshaonis]|uniref:Uncharacterized protein n=1 Tax=Xiamenia xianingshaonis TaxID=2682776 RepID=A0A9E6SUY4_9ACTN|nr:hypothetical protein [Xiamenia xianingshaonis]NHM14538.1 hypothetical protein [Xiamenia xianingshaonis]QTU85011.1 hypothetical protein J7S26_03655 [Xiamenia xianingshaonis]
MSALFVHPRIHRKHPDVSDEDVRHVMRSMIAHQQRETGEWVAVGVDGNSRLLELVYAYDEEEEAFLVYHGMTPPSRKTLQELGLER